MPATPANTTFHERVRAVLSHPHDDMTADELAGLLGIDRCTINRAVKAGRIEAMLIHARGEGRNCQQRITKSAVVVWIWRNTTGDKAVLRAELRATAPHLLDMLDPAEEANAAIIPANVLHFRSPRRARHTAHVDVFAGHPDLFDRAE